MISLHLKACTNALTEGPSTILSMKKERGRRNDFPVAYHNKLYQIEERTGPSKMIAHDQNDGSMRITYRDRMLRFKEMVQGP